MTLVRYEKSLSLARTENSMANPVDKARNFLFALLIRGFGSGGERGGQATTGACGGGKLGRGLKCQLAHSTRERLN
jgi:hypothetical protein